MTIVEDNSTFRRDNDSLYVLPLEIVKIETPGLRRARLRKNSKLEPVRNRVADRSKFRTSISFSAGPPARRIPTAN